jgi:2,3-bisphosphoglycerate-dependent phosphoglycerate mutase
MAVGLFVDPVWYKIGASDFLNSFFSTVVYNLENNERGSRFPLLMKDLYNGKLVWKKAKDALQELDIIKQELKKLSIDKVVWDLSDPLKKQSHYVPKMGIADLSAYFISSEGKDLIDLFKRALEAAIELEDDLSIRAL